MLMCLIDFRSYIDVLADLGPVLLMVDKEEGDRKGGGLRCEYLRKG